MRPWLEAEALWREARVGLERVDLYNSRAQLDREAPRGHGEPVMLIPGYLAGDLSLGGLAGWLRGIGYAPQQAAITANVDCATRTTERLIERLEVVTERHDRRAVLVGHSLGGVLGRLLAVQRPDLVRGVVCLGSPLVDFNAVHPLVWASVRVVGMLGSLGFPGVLSHGCLTGACCAESRGLLRAPFPPGVGFVSLYSRRDRIVDWRACLDPAAEHVEVGSTHIGMPVNAAVYRALGKHLASLSREPIPQPMQIAA
jgi:pimeloyl-ACP methyl ester carboxylesterase